MENTNKQVVSQHSGERVTETQINFAPDYSEKELSDISDEEGKAYDKLEELKVYCFNCGKRLLKGKRWYHADQDDLVCLDCAEELEHTDTCYAGQSVSKMPTEINLNRMVKRTPIYLTDEDRANQRDFVVHELTPQQQYEMTVRLKAEVLERITRLKEQRIELNRELKQSQDQFTCDSIRDELGKIDCELESIEEAPN